MTPPRGNRGARPNTRGRGSASDDAPLVEIGFQKSHLCRVIHVDGAWGGVNSQGNIQVAVYSQLNANPEQVSYRVEENRLTEHSRDMPSGPPIVREIEAELLLTIPVAENLLEWLQDKIEQAKAVKEEVESAESSDDSGAQS